MSELVKKAWINGESLIRKSNNTNDPNEKILYLKEAIDGYNILIGKEEISEDIWHHIVSIAAELIHFQALTKSKEVTWNTIKSVDNILTNAPENTYRMLEVAIAEAKLEYSDPEGEIQLFKLIDKLEKTNDTVNALKAKLILLVYRQMNGQIQSIKEISSIVTNIKKINEIMYLRGLICLGTAYRYKMELKKAEQMLEAALIRGSEVNDSEIEGWAMLWLGLVKKDMGDTKSAVEYIIKTRNIGRKFSYRKLTLTANGNYARMISKKDPEKALNINKENLELAKGLNNRNAIAWALVNMGEINSNQGRHEEALQQFMAALEVSTSDEHVYRWANSQVMQTLLALDRIEEAKAFVRKKTETEAILIESQENQWVYLI